jgi:hypothetical protein
MFLDRRTCGEADGSWSYQRHTGLEAVVAIASIECSVMLADVYERVAVAG